MPYLVVGVQTCCFENYTLYSVRNVHAIFKGCAGDAQTATGFSNNPRANLVLCAYD